MKHWIIVGMLLCLALSAAMASPGKPNKLPAPTNVTCPTFIDVDFGPITLVSADAVEGAAGYQVRGTCAFGEGQELESSNVRVTFPIPLLIPPICDTFDVEVRALPGPKKEGRPLQGGGPKGQWSEECPVSVP